MSDSKENGNGVQKRPWNPMDGMRYSQSTDPVPESDQVFLKTKYGCIHPLVTVEAGSGYFCLDCYKDGKLYTKDDPELKEFLEGTELSPCGDPSIRVLIGQVQVPPRSSHPLFSRYCRKRDD